MFFTILGAGGSVVSKETKNNKNKKIHSSVKMKNNQTIGYLGYIGQVIPRAMKSNRVGYRE